ncbi:hypothetical protein [Thalassotalea sediminis]|uniref:hypothetical protein n=1 Tax=Thalassotalea sediminis TaxID=1759089 RepID=UPI002572B034|nr:hypothetical protein [Thalassotalea sediminis]
MLVTLIFSALQSQPKNVQLHQISPEGAKQSQQLLKKLVASGKTQGHQQIRITKDELDGLAALLHRALPHVAANAVLNKQHLTLFSTITLPLPDIIKHLNVSIVILPSKEGLKVKEFSAGHLTINGRYFISTLSYFVDVFIKPNLLSDMLAMIKKVGVNASYVEADLYMDNRLIDRNNDNSVLIKLRDDLALFGDAKEIKLYYQVLANFAETQKMKSSIAGYIREVFLFAQQRTHSEIDTNALLQNQSAIMALVIYFGTDRFEMLVGDIIGDNVAQITRRNRIRYNTRLQGRKDLQKHFIYSMALQMFSSLGASDAIGEYKEFLDSNGGGSGFSFADLMADRAGTRLAKIVVANEGKALQAQTILTNITDESLLPSIEGLDEGISQQEFVKVYQGINHKGYQQTLRDIDARIESLPLYQLGW